MRRTNLPPRPPTLLPTPPLTLLLPAILAMLSTAAAATAPAFAGAAPAVGAAPAAPAVAPPAGPAPAPVAEAPIPPAELLAMLKREVGRDLLTKEVEARLLDAHALIEAWFAARPAERGPIVQQLEATGLDVNILGRIARIRSNWPALRGGVYYVNERVGPHDVIYFLGVPEAYDRARPWPLVLKLPGAHAFVKEPRPGPDEVAQIYDGWIKDELARHPDALVLMPLLNLDELFGPSTAGMNTVIQPMHHAASRVNVDPARVYMLGQGMAAHATWNIALHYPTYFAAINPLAGGTAGAWQRIRLGNLRNVFVVAWQDAQDTVLKPTYARDTVRILRQLKYDVEYEETQGMGHAPTEELADRLYAKMRARTRNLYPPELALTSNRPDTMFNRSDWVQVYQMLEPGRDQRVRFLHGSGHMTFSQNSYTLTSAITAPNRLEFATQNVESFRIYVNDRMVDLRRPVTVIVNRKARFEGLVKPSVDEMLKDQLFLGRGWRYYAGVIDIDFGAPATRPASRPVGKPLVRPGP